MVPYATLVPLKAVLPIRSSDAEIPKDRDGIGGIGLGSLDRRMRDRWQIVSRLWEENKAAANKLDLLGRLDYHRELSSQLEWHQNPRERPFRVVYNQSGTPTAALIHDDEAVMDKKLYWVTCRALEEAYYLLGIINSQVHCTMSVASLMPKGQFGARDLEKHLWKLPIPEFDPGDPLHTAVSDAGESAAAAASDQLAQLRQQRDRVTVTIARRELRKWLRTSPEGQSVEDPP